MEKAIKIRNCGSSHTKPGENITAAG